MPLGPLFCRRSSSFNACGEIKLIHSISLKINFGGNYPNKPLSMLAVLQNCTLRLTNSLTNYRYSNVTTNFRCFCFRSPLVCYLLSEIGKGKHKANHLPLKFFSHLSHPVASIIVDFCKTLSIMQRKRRYHCNAVTFKSETAE